MAFQQDSAYFFYSYLRNENVYLFDRELVMSCWQVNNYMRVVYMDGRIENIDVPFTVQMVIEEEEQNLPPVIEEEEEDILMMNYDEEEDETDNDSVLSENEEHPDADDEAEAEEDDEEDEEDDDELTPPNPVTLNDYLDILGP